MRVTNNTKLPTPFLRAMTRWVLKEMVSAYLFKNGVVSFRSTLEETRVRISAGVMRDNVHLTVHLGPTETTDGPGADIYAKGRLFKVIVLIAAELCPSKVPAGELGVYRQPIGASFTSQAEDLIAKWKQNVLPPDPNANRKAKVKLATAQVKLWARRLKLAKTKSSKWERRLKAAQRALDKAMEK